MLGERPGDYKKGDYVTDMPALTVAAYFYAKFENIHPFSDGNGRTGRLLMNYLLILMNHPPIVIHEEDRKAYYDTLECFDSNLDLKPFQEFLKMQTVKTWEKSLLQKERRVVENKDMNLSNIVRPRDPKL